jgi:hypothetical protein
LGIIIGIIIKYNRQNYLFFLRMDGATPMSNQKTIICHSERREATVLVVKDKVSQIARVVGA